VTILYATCRGDRRFYDGELRDTLTLADAVAAAKPGDVVQLLPGAFFPPTRIDPGNRALGEAFPVEIRGFAGSQDAPLTIRGFGPTTAFYGEGKAEIADARLPTADQFAFFKLFDSQWVVFENFDVAGCWPCFLFMEHSRYVTVRNVRVFDGRYVVFARGERSHHILIEGCRWRQDPTGALWRDITWEAVKREDPSGYYYYNGGFFGSVDISGSLVFRENTLCTAFNGLRLKASASKGDRLNHNVEITGNRFHRLRDNPVEPERTAVNWYVRGNRIVNAHAWFSMDNVAGGFWYYCGNTGSFNDKPGLPEGDNTGGAVYKYDSEGGMPDRPALAAFNTYFLRANLIKEGRTKRLRHVDNVVLFCTPADLRGYDPDPPCPFPASCPDPCAPSPLTADPESFGCVPPLAEPGPSFVASPEFLDDPAGDDIVFDGDLTNRPWPAGFAPAGFETAGRVVPELHFRAPFAGDLRLSGPSLPAVPVTLAAGTDWAGDYDWHSPPLALAGAAQPAGAPAPCPPFVFCMPANPAPGYDEAPRPVDLSLEAGQLVVHWSRPLVAGTCRALVRDRRGEVLEVAGRADGTRLFLAIPGAWRRKAAGVAVPADLAGADGQRVSLWGNDPRVTISSKIHFTTATEGLTV
jgi:hypothetical protein